MPTTDSLVRAVVLVAIVVLLAPLLMMLFMMPLVGFGHMGWAGTAGTGWPWLLGWASVLLIVLVGGYLLYGALGGSDERESDAAIAELRTAYARGEMSTEEFEERRELLQRTE
ncbi:SHOCT domain-containing protein [Halalkalicoccus sp. NIPERK01]|uniref:SHOCT domain-containing protein n=1 Tax=Halalkalicoccus sp. NIPERK01 TaxID=3053469 RepID=UPI00256F0ACF|nr:SHOCT domain-containing protein [Halalkalicoccus sp. NIPERK01]MDL5362576.1 SHOCT domain-containing protein [Halalkalicoccus sp. NIPERK01]